MLSPGRMLRAEAGPGLTKTTIIEIGLTVKKHERNTKETRSMNNETFSFSDSIIKALEGSLSPERMSTYAVATGGQIAMALRLYTWNTAISAAFYGPLQGMEVALRNAMHRTLSATYSADWYDNPACGFDLGTIGRITKVKNDLKRNKYPLDPPHVVAALSFGFWVALLGKGGRTGVLGSTKSNYDMTLWRPSLYKAFPHGRMRRADVHKPLDYLRTLRNRIAHHEPIFQRHLNADYQQILTVTGWICASTRDWIAHHSRVEQVLKLQKNSEAIAF
jgi:hypothetical protein